MQPVFSVESGLVDSTEGGCRGHRGPTLLTVVCQRAGPGQFSLIHSSSARQLPSRSATHSDSFISSFLYFLSARIARIGGIYQIYLGIINVCTK